MKKQIFTLGLMLAATFTLTNCDKISENEQFAKNDFTIFATPSVETRTVNEGVTSSWKANDALSVMHAVAGSSNYVKDGKFVVAENDVDAGRFTGELGEALDASKSYDWYMIYPYSGKMEDPVNDGKCFFYVGRGATSSQTQNGNDSMDHLSGSDVPLYGTVKGLSGSANPAVTMHHLCAAVAFNLTNNSGKAITVSSIEFTSTEPIVGTYYINIVDEPVYVSSSDTYVSNTAKLAVSGGSSISNGNSAKFYMAIKPHTVAKGGKISVRVTTSAGVFEKEISASSAASFEAGKIQTLNINYTGGNVDQNDHGATTVAAFNAAAESTDDWYQLTGVVSNLKAGDKYGNFDLTDATGSVYVYGVLSEKGGAKQLFQELVTKYGIANGGTITIKANRGSFDGKIEAMNAYFISYDAGEGGDVVIDGYKFEWSSSSDWTKYDKDNCEDATKYGVEITKDGYTVKAVKNNGGSAPIVSSSNDFRSYAKNTVTISNSSKAMTEMVFIISDQGQKRLTDITASTGNVTIDADNWTVTWKGSAKSVDFLVGEKATYGTEGNTKAGQFDFNYFTIK